MKLVVSVALAAVLIPAPAAEVRAAGSVEKAAACIPAWTGNRTIRVRGQVGTRDSVWITVDTGASSSVLDHGQAKKLGLKVEGTQQSRGAGGYQTGSEAHDVELRLLGFELRGRRIDTLPLENLATRSGVPVHAILGYELFSRRVVELDYAGGCMRLYDPRRYDYRGDGAVLPLEFHENHPYVAARVVLPGGRTFDGKFELDTGSSAALLLGPETAERERVLDSMARTRSASGMGVGGAIESRIGRADRLELGPFRLEAPLTALHPPGPGRISAPGTDGNIGGTILARFKVIFDYSRKRVILEPNASLDDPFESDMSGLGLVAELPDLRTVRVARVQEESPASEAGVRAGDELARVDGRPAAEIGLPALREMLRREGREVRLELLRGTERIEVTIRTRRLI